jgi:uncharacterized protein (TIGR03083 family)
MSTRAREGSPAPDLDHVRREALRFTEVAARSPLPARVPAYPAFTVETLTAHIGRVLRGFPAILAPGSEAGPPEPPAGPAVIGWAADGLEPLLTLLAGIPPDRPVTFPHGRGERPASKIAPLLAVEVGVHRWDLETVLGEHAPVPADLAASEIDSVFENFAPRLAGAGVAPIGGALHLRATDFEASWTVTVQDGALQAGRSANDQGVAEPSVGNHEAGDTVVSGPAADLALIVWKRLPPPLSAVTVTGPSDVLERFLATNYIPDPRTTPAR